MSVPATALIAAASSERIEREAQGGDAWRLQIASQNAPSPPSGERATTAASGMRTMTLSQSVATPEAERARRASRGARQRAASGKRPKDGHLAVETPASSSILAIEPFSGSKSSSLTFVPAA